MLKARNLAGAVALMALVIGLQIYSRAYQSDFGATPDEPSHVVSSLMVRDYFVSHNIFHPWEFAKSYYLHYPKVAILHWPPLFHFAEALWMLPAGRSRLGLLSFQAVTIGALAIGIFLVLVVRAGYWIALGSARRYSRPAPLLGKSASQHGLSGCACLARLCFRRCWLMPRCHSEVTLGLMDLRPPSSSR